MAKFAPKYMRIFPRTAPIIINSELLERRHFLWSLVAA
jgi:hypothetical protein